MYHHYYVPSNLKCDEFRDDMTLRKLRKKYSNTAKLHNLFGIFIFLSQYFEFFSSIRYLMYIFFLVEIVLLLLNKGSSFSYQSFMEKFGNITSTSLTTESTESIHQMKKIAITVQVRSIVKYLNHGIHSLYRINHIILLSIRDENKRHEILWWAPAYFSMH